MLSSKPNAVEIPNKPFGVMVADSLAFPTPSIPTKP